jgi:hypothetical protein
MHSFIGELHHSAGSWRNVQFIMTFVDRLAARIGDIRRVSQEQSEQRSQSRLFQPASS